MARTVDEAKDNLARILEHRGISPNDPHVNQALYSLTSALAVEASGVERRLRAFLDAGYRPLVTTHAFAWSEERTDEGWATFLVPDPYDPLGTLDHPDEPLPMERRSMGFVVNARSFRGTQDVHGGTFATVDQALTYAEAELAKYAPK